MTSTPEEVLRKGKKKTLSARQWSEIVNLARNGKAQSDIARIYDVSPSTITRGLQNRNVKVGDLLEEARRNEEIRERERVVEEIKKVRKNAVQRIELIENQTLLVFKRAGEEKKPIGSFLDDFKALKLAGDIFARGQDVKHRALGMDKENSDADAAVPELVVRRMTDEEVITIRDKQVQSEGEISPEDLRWIEDQAARDIDRELDDDNSDPDGIVETD